jgi:glycosyltransferase involved in cell wall biosynthesis
MKAAISSLYDINNPKFWSGTIHFMTQGLKNQGIELVIPQIFQIPYRSFYRAKSIFKKRILNSLYFSEREPLILQSFARHFEKQLNENDYDFIFSPQTSELRYLETSKPMFFWVDATMEGLEQQLTGRMKLNKKALELGYSTDSAVYLKSAAAIFASDWAANSAIKTFGLNPEKVHVVPFGANLNSPPSEPDIKQIINQKKFDKFRIIFIAVNWEQKGGDIVIDTLNLLDKDKIELNVIGAEPIIKGATPSYLKYHGFLSKNNPDNVTKMKNILSESHLMFMPSRQEAYGIVLCEANAYGLPVISSNIGGIPTIVREDTNGFLYPLNTDITEIAAKIQTLMDNRAELERLSLSSYNQFTERLNWNVACKRVKEIIGSHI